MLIREEILGRIHAQRTDAAKSVTEYHGVCPLPLPGIHLYLYMLVVFFVVFSRSQELWTVALISACPQLIRATSTCNWLRHTIAWICPNQGIYRSNERHCHLRCSLAFLAPSSSRPSLNFFHLGPIFTSCATVAIQYFVEPRNSQPRLIVWQPRRTNTML